MNSVDVPQISEDLSQEENQKVNLTWMIAEAKKDWKIDINELVSIEENIQNDQIDVKNSTINKLNQYRNDILENWIDINQNNKERILKYLLNEWFNIPNNIKNIEWNLTITIDENNNIIEEWFISTSFNNNEKDVSENDFNWEFNSKLTNEYLETEWPDIIINWLNYLWDKLSEKWLPKSFLSDIKDFVDWNYENMNNEEKLLLIISFKEMQEWNYSKVLNLFEEKLTSWRHVDAIATWFLLMAVAVAWLLGTAPLWIIASWAFVVGSLPIYAGSMIKEMDLLNKMEATNYEIK